MKSTSRERTTYQEIDWSVLEVHEVLEALEVHPDQGLLPDEVNRRQQEYGANRLEPAFRTRFRGNIDAWLESSIWGAALAGVAFFLAGWWQAGWACVGIAALNLAFFNQKSAVGHAGIGVNQPLVPNQCRVRRNSRVVKISAADLVPGDILVLENGDWIAADARLLESASLRVVETALNGDIQPIDKVPQRVHGPAHTQTKPHNLVYQGTQVVHGMGVATVVRTGSQTELARLSMTVSTSGRKPLPLEKAGKIYRRIAFGGFTLASSIGIWYWHTHSSPITNLLAYLGIIALATTPLGLPTVFWILFKRAKRRATAAGIRAETFKPIEQLAAIDVLCASPTGIFTEPFFSLTAADCTGHTLNAEISLNNGNPQLLPGDPRKHHPRATHALLLSVGALCNNASLEHSIQAAEDYIAYGEPDEGALLVMAGRLGLWKARLDRLFPRLMEAPFSVERGRMSSLHEARLTPHLSEAELPLTGILRSRRSYLVAAKGDFSSILEICSRIWVEGKSIPLDSEWRKKVSLQAEELAGQGGRIIGVAIRQLPRLPALVEDYQLPLQGFPEHLKDIPRSKKDIPLAPEAAEEFERDMILTGMIVLSIDPHPEAQTSVEACQREGLQLIMMTRTNPSQARETSLNLHMNPNQVASVCEGKRLAQNSGSAGREMLLRANVWTQFTPQQRVLAIQILQENGRRVAYTGQDASDRPAMQQADVGIQLPGPNPAIAPIPGSLVMFTPGLRSIYEGIITARESVAGCRRAYVISGLVSLALLGWIVAMWIRSGGYKLPSPGMLGIFLGLGLAVEIGVGIGKKSRSRVED